MSKSLAGAIYQHFSDNDVYLGTDMTVKREAEFLAKELTKKGFDTPHSYIVKQIKLGQAVARMELQLRQIAEVLEEVRVPESKKADYQWALRQITKIIEFGKEES